MDKRKNIFAILISPVIGEISFLILFFIITLVDNVFPKEMDGPMIGDRILYYFFFPILFVGALIFQIIILEPIFRRYRKRNELNKSLIKKICIISILSFSILFSLPMTFASIFGNVQFEVVGIMTEFFVALAIWSSYFIPNMLSYYLFYIKQTEMIKRD
ncbi:hypothetical protein P700755_002818 [Psychroflexus torquis ATCC 700755]|uniref:Uncharacterized protein n=1 Tax=Psychroflexus torquis (strain ATCC 700755 / CIP 106069 / ACAM 623) TaxID=313595 RepID=K4IKB9_PSYTT|nr:hypothetical protein [Psychroflexus torquis]AFU69536.1 hypothetical protein P700755_002818 [Psychroflexus torquis ATCC 700755]